MRISLMAVLAAVFVLALGGTALAQNSPTQDAYGGVLGNEVDNSTGGGGDAVDNGGGDDAQVAAAEAGSGSLPFTGFEVGLVVLTGIGLVALGFAMRRGTRRPPA